MPRIHRQRREDGEDALLELATEELAILVGE